MNASYSIPETAKLTGIPEHAIREYARQFADVLPSPETSDGGRATVKRYPDAALSVFRSIRKLKDEGLDTAQIRTALQGPGSTDTYGDWDNIALQTSAEAAPDAEAGSETEWQEAATETPAEAAPAEHSHEETHEASTGEWSGHETEVEAQPAADAGVEWTGETHEASAEWSPASVHEETDCSAEAVTAMGEATGEDTHYEATAEATEETVCEAAAEATEMTADATVVEEEFIEAVHEASEAITEAENAGPATFHPLFTNLTDGLVQLRKIMDENTDERESLRTEREQLLAETATQSEEIDSLKSTVAAQEAKIGGLQSALGALMSQCDQQLQAIRSALGQA